ncbi:MAG TPA: hypothetical protein VG412_00170 [Acidimicrobiales bacterium]|nr:hypothetical protein [Acidimicrobiales bacterium]
MSGSVATSTRYCTGCGRSEADCAGCGRALDPPRFCVACGRRLTVAVSPGGYRARCRDHGEATSEPAG